MKYLVILVIVSISLQIENSVEFNNMKNRMQQGQNPIQPGPPNTQPQPGMLPPQPIIINGGSMPALNIFHQPINLPTVLKNSLETFKSLQDLQNLNQKIEREMAKRDPSLSQKPSSFMSEMSQAAVMNAFGSPSMLGDYSQFDQTQIPQTNQQHLNPPIDPDIQPNIQQKIVIGDSTDQQQLQIEKGNQYKHEFQRLTSILKNNRFKQIQTNKCINKSGFLKIKNIYEQFNNEQQKSQLYFVVLNKSSMAYFQNDQKASSFENSVDLKAIKEVQMMPNYDSCFYLISSVQNQDLSICAQTVEDAQNWIQNINNNIKEC